MIQVNLDSLVSYKDNMEIIRSLKIFVLSFLVLILSSCEDAMKVVDVELRQFPDNIVYYVNESNEVDLTGLQ